MDITACRTACRSALRSRSEAMIMTAKSGRREGKRGGLWDKRPHVAINTVDIRALHSHWLLRSLSLLA